MLMKPGQEPPGFSESPFYIRLLLPNAEPRGFPGYEGKALDFLCQDHLCWAVQVELMAFPPRLPEQSAV